eukprot:3594553-Lingulodinium_polyedra.AAC.1
MDGSPLGKQVASTPPKRAMASLAIRSCGLMLNSPQSIQQQLKPATTSTTACNNLRLPWDQPSPVMK